MNYFKHLFYNWKVSGKALVLFFFHFIHGLVPIKYTEHSYWKFDLTEKK
jgi:hypothetical protein